MYSTSIRKKCPLCSKLFLVLKDYYFRLFRRGRRCREIFEAARDSKKLRVAQVRGASPDCACEAHSVSRYSPGPVKAGERLVRFIFDPIHTQKKTGKIMPSVFSQVGTDGCSIQRDSVAADDELSTFVRDFLDADDKRAWLGVLSASCDAVRAIAVQANSPRAVCVYDTGERHNTSHAELFHAYEIPEADVLEVRRLLFAALGDGALVKPQGYRTGSIWGQLPVALRERVPVRR